VLIIEQLAPERADARHTTVIRGDIQMMVSTGGMERTVAEYESLLERAGLRLARVLPTKSHFSILEATAT
jgi:hypothetical protein